MDGRRRRVVAALAMAGGIGMYSGLSPAASSAGTSGGAELAFPTLVSVSQVGAGLGSIGPGIGIGIVQAVQVRRSTRVGLAVSLHRLAPGTSYLVGYSPRPCSLTGDFNRDGDVDAADFLLSRVVTSGRTMDNAFRTGRVTRRGALSSARSVRVIDITDPRRPQRSCGTTSLYSNATGGRPPLLATGQIRSGPISGLLPAVQASRSTSRISLPVSLHGLAPGTSYLVGVSARRCTQSADADQDGDSDGADFLAFRTFTTARTNDDVFRTGRVTRRGSLASARSVRIIDAIRKAQVSCAATLNASTGALD